MKSYDNPEARCFNEVSIGDIVQYAYSLTTTKWGYVVNTDDNERSMSIRWFCPETHMVDTLWAAEYGTFWKRGDDERNKGCNTTNWDDSSCNVQRSL